MLGNQVLHLCKVPLPRWQQHALDWAPVQSASGQMFTEALCRCREMYTGQKPWIGMSRDEVTTKVLAGERLIFPKQVPKAFQVRQQSHHGVLPAMQGQSAHCHARLGVSGHQDFLHTRCRPLLMTAWPQMSLVAHQQERSSDR